MALDLGKATGQVVDLSKEAGRDVNKVVVHLTWKANSTDGKGYDPDVVGFGVGGDGKVLNGDSNYFVRGFGNTPKQSPDGAIKHLTGDDTTGASGGEKLEIDSATLNSGVTRIPVAVTIFHASSRGHNFGLIGEISYSVIDAETNEVLVTGDLGFDNSMHTAVNAVEIIPRNGKLYVKPVGTGYNGGLGGLCKDYGIEIGKNDYDDGVDS